MANKTDKEKALEIVVKQIKDLDKNKLVLDVLNCGGDLFHARANLFNIISNNDFELTKDYKLIKKS